MIYLLKKQSDSLNRTLRFMQSHNFIIPGKLTESEFSLIISDIPMPPSVNGTPQNDFCKNSACSRADDSGKSKRGMA
jgi:hypothetical protein